MAYMQIAQPFLLHNPDPDSRSQYFPHLHGHNGSWPAFDPKLIGQGLSSNYYRQAHQVELSPDAHDLYTQSHEYSLCDAHDYGGYASPATPFSGTPSEFSSATEQILTLPDPPQKINSDASLALQSHPIFDIRDDPAPFHTGSWEPAGQGASMHFASPGTVAAFIVPSQSNVEIYDFQQHDEHEPIDGVKHDDEIMTLHASSPVHVLQPEELELSESSTMSTVSSISGDQPRPVHAIKAPREHKPGDREEDSEEDMVVDNESDSDFTTSPKRKRASKSSGSQKTVSPNLRRHSPKQAVGDKDARIHKRNDSNTASASGHQRRPSKTKVRSKGPSFRRTLSSHTIPLAKADRVFPCTFHHFGCTQEFPNKNEWKRHVACQHLQLGFYRCDLGSCNPENTMPIQNSSSKNSRRIAPRSNPVTCDDEIVVTYNDFNRKDLFTQHCRRMHGPARNEALCSNPRPKKGRDLNPTKEDEAAFENQLETIRQRCWQVRRNAPSRSICPYCSEVFDAAYKPLAAGADEKTKAAERAWEERMEHLGRHYEKDGYNRAREEPDEDLETWGLSTGVLKRLEDGRAWLMHAEAPGTLTTGEDDQEFGMGTGIKKVRRQPSRTVVVKRLGRVTGSGGGLGKENDEDVDAIAEDE